MQSTPLPPREQALNEINSIIRNRSEWMRENAVSTPDAPGSPTIHALFSDDGAGMAFIVVEASQPLPDGLDRLRPLIESCRAACANVLNSPPEISGDGMHVVIMHGGDLSASDMEGLVDRSGQLATHCLSVTLVDYASGQTAQDMFWPGQVLDRLQVADRARVNGTLADLRGNSPAPAQTRNAQVARSQATQSQSERILQQQRSAERRTRSRRTPDNAYVAPSARSTSAVLISPTKMTWFGTYRLVFSALVSVLLIVAAFMGIGALIVFAGLLQVDGSSDLPFLILIGLLIIAFGYIAFLLSPFAGFIKIITDSITYSVRGSRVRRMPWKEAFWRAIEGYLMWMLVIIFSFIVMFFGLVIGLALMSEIGIIGLILAIVGVGIGVGINVMGLPAVVLKVLTDSVSAYASYTEVRRKMPWTDAFRRVFTGLMEVVVLLGIGIAIIALSAIMFYSLYTDPFFYFSSISIRVLLLPTGLAIIGLVITFLGMYAVILKLLSDSISASISNNRGRTMSRRGAFIRVFSGIWALMLSSAIGCAVIVIGIFLVIGVSDSDLSENTGAFVLGILLILAGLIHFVVGFIAIVIKSITDSVADLVAG